MERMREGDWERGEREEGGSNERRKKVERSRGAVHTTIDRNMKTLTVSSIFYPYPTNSSIYPHPTTSLCPSLSHCINFAYVLQFVRVSAADLRPSDPQIRISQVYFFSYYPPKRFFSLWIAFALVLLGKDCLLNQCFLLCFAFPSIILEFGPLLRHRLWWIQELHSQIDEGCNV